MENIEDILKDLMISSELALTALKILKPNCSEVSWLEDSINKAKDTLKEQQ